MAPLRFGAGLKGKVLESFAAGVPCVMSPMAAEGLGLPAGLQELVGADGASLAALILRLHSNRAVHGKVSRAASHFMQARHDKAAVRAALLAEIEGRRAPG